MTDHTPLIGHAEAQAWLRRLLASDRLTHAYLLTGPRGVGRRTFALEMAKALNCTADSVADRPDHSCKSCRMIEGGKHPDVRVIRRRDRRGIYVHAAPGGGATGWEVDYIGFIQSEAQLRPVQGRKRVYVITNAEDLTEDAADRLLKTIEEPSPHVQFLLTAVDRGGVMPTIVSRCQEIRLRPAGRQELAKALVALGAEPDRAQQLAALSGGRQGWAVAAVREPALFEHQQAYAETMVELLGISRVERLVHARGLSERWSSQPDTVRDTLRAWLAWWRDVVLIQLGLTERMVHLEAGERDALGRAAEQVSAQGARGAAAMLQQTLADLDANVNARLALDLLLLRLPRMSFGA